MTSQVHVWDLDVMDEDVVAEKVRGSPSGYLPEASLPTRCRASLPHTLQDLLVSVHERYTLDFVLMEVSITATAAIIHFVAAKVR